NPGLPSLRSEQRDATIRASDAQIDPIDGTRRAFLAFLTIGITAFACAVLHPGRSTVNAVVLFATLAATAAVIYALYHRWPTIALRRAPFLRRIPVRITAATVL